MEEVEPPVDDRGDDTSSEASDRDSEDSGRDREDGESDFSGDERGDPGDSYGGDLDEPDNTMIIIGSVLLAAGIVWLATFLILHFRQKHARPSGKPPILLFLSAIGPVMALVGTYMLVSSIWFSDRSSSYEDRDDRRDRDSRRGRDDRDRDRDDRRGRDDQDF
jgi:hypothetical protein